MLHQQVNPITAINEPIQVPNIKPAVKTIGSPKPNIKTQIIVNKKNKVNKIKFCSFKLCKIISIIFYKIITCYFF